MTYQEKVLKKYPDNCRYDYRLVEMKKAKDKIKIICPIHGVFEQRADLHLQGRQCPKCSKTVKKTTEQFIQEAQEIYGDKFDYSLVNYNGAFSNIKIICKKHDQEIEVMANNFLKYHYTYCEQCKTDLKIQECKNVINSCSKIHNNKYDYSLVPKKFNMKDKIKIICPIHGVFEQTADNHLHHGCKLCQESRGEKAIAEFLTERKIEFIQQKRFSDCRDKQPLPFDFYIPSKNLLIEFDGIQHYKPIDRFGGEKAFLETQRRDAIKTEWAKKNGYDLLRIRYNENLQEKLSKQTQTNFDCLLP